MSDLINREDILCLSYCVKPTTIDNIYGSEPVVNVSDIENAPSINAIVLPCKVGDTLFRKDGMWECIGFDCDQTGNWRVKLRQDNARNLYNKNCNNYLYTRMVFGSFGKTVFTSREEYEKVFPPKPIDKKLKETQERLAEQQKQHQQWLLDKHLSKCCFD